ncbi:hypothetical protein [Roseicitreum antarcticum]|uniref:Lipoprotein-attachment site-containing protein n=1 Tax=Roseicitreum antarcticum TaxID=564137 RepID=A0A1H2VWB2_9RHOB|nr:hypothetical protein [Roseicitreum antarcticum]SDW72655.1 hypothetical protein SAMN04488238_103194 [Roseicitreum antarcticum]
MSKKTAVMAVFALTILGACAKHSGPSTPPVEPIPQPIYVEPVSGKYR